MKPKRRIDVELQKTWLDELLEVAKDAETPRSFIFWSGLFCIGASTKRKIYLPKGNIYNLYPNLYVLLMAESGLGKQFPIDLSKTLLRTSGQTRLISGSNSIQGIMGRMSKMTTLESKVMVKNSEGVFVTGEFVNFLLDDPLALSTMMEWYDTHAHDVWEKTLKNESFILREVFVSLLAATNLELFNDRVPEKDVKGGFLGRMLPIHETDPSQLNSLTKAGDPIDYKNLAERLTKISQLSGTFQYEEGASEFYDEWYYDFYKDRSRRQDKARFSNRLRDHILKVAMNLSLAYKYELVLTKEDIAAAIMLCEPLVETVVNLTEEMGRNKFRSINAEVIQALIKAKDYTIPYSKLLRSNRGEATMKEFEEVLNTLVSSEMIEQCMTGEGMLAYKLTDVCINQLLKVKKKGK